MRKWWLNAVGTAGIGFVECERQPPKIGDTRSSALRPRMGYQSVNQPLKISKYCDYMYLSDLGECLAHLEVPGWSMWRLTTWKYRAQKSVLRRTVQEEIAPAETRSCFLCRQRYLLAVAMPLFVYTWPILLSNWGADFEANCMFWLNH
jgi:hypothetical protein